MTEATSFFSTWRESDLVGDRQVLDGVLRPEYQGPSRDELARFLRGWPGAWYWADAGRTRLVMVRGSAPARPERWLWHGALLILFLICTLGAGAVVAGRLAPAMHPGIGGAISGALDFGEFVVHHWEVLSWGWDFALPLIAILLIHEMGHYVAARRYAIDVSPPYFIPVPPNLSPIGGLGAFIRLRSAVYDRRQLLDVGAAGPLAGFVVAVAVLLWGYQLSHRVHLPLPIEGSPAFIVFGGRPIVLGDSLLTRYLCRWIIPGDGAVLLSPQAFAGWVGLFITGLNLLPLSQLDGGHVWYGLIGRWQRAAAIVAAAGMIVLATRAPMWYIWAGLTFVIGGARWSHPDVVIPNRGVHRGGWVVGALAVAVCALTLVPVPFR